MPRVSKTLVATILLLAGFGVLALWNLYPPADLSEATITKSIFLKHLTFLAAALALLGLAAVPPPSLYRRLAWPAYAAGVLSLVLLLVLARSTRGTRGWFAIGPFNLQPAEFFKIALVLALARTLMYGRAVQTWSGLALPCLVAAVPAVLILIQPDLGTTLLFLPTLFSMLFVAGARKRHLAILASVLIAAAPVAYFTVLKPYQRERLTAFLGDGGYQQRQSELACASGRLLGSGLGESGAGLPFYVPDRHTDFVYSIIAEELGFAGSTFVLFLYLALFAQFLRVAHRTNEPFGRLTATGMTAWMATQTLINLGMTLGVAPITGLTLPFVSYGGSSLFTCSIAAGIVLNLGARWQPAFASRDTAGGSVEINGLLPRSASGAAPSAH
jgi:rod shape determining protein RodA